MSVIRSPMGVDSIPPITLKLVTAFGADLDRSRHFHSLRQTAVSAVSVEIQTAPLPPKWTSVLLLPRLPVPCSLFPVPCLSVNPLACAAKPLRDITHPRPLCNIPTSRSYLIAP